MKIYPVRERVIGDVVAEKAALHGERTFVHFEDRRYSYRDLDLLSNRIANGLAQLGVKMARMWPSCSTTSPKSS